MDNRFRLVDFSSGRHAALPIEVVEFGALIDRVGDEYFEISQRPSFGLMFVVRNGVGSHTVDFEVVPLVAGQLVFVRRGQVQQWQVSRRPDVAVVLARETLIPVGGWFPGELPYRDLSVDSMKTAVDLVSALTREQERPHRRTLPRRTLKRCGDRGCLDLGSHPPRS